MLFFCQQLLKSSQARVKSNLSLTAINFGSQGWSLFRGSFMFQKLELGPQNISRCRQAVVYLGFTIYKMVLEVILTIQCTG